LPEQKQTTSKIYILSDSTFILVEGLIPAFGNTLSIQLHQKPDTSHCFLTPILFLEIHFESCNSVQN